ncbi:MAG: VWA domain-containing protein [Ilumatobacteraceae bacterium]
MPEFKAEVFQNEYLSEGATDAHAVVSVSCTGAGTAGQTGSGDAAEVIIVDTSGSMDMPPTKIAAARRAAKAGVQEIVDGTWFAVISGHSVAQMVYPPHPGMAQMTAVTRDEALTAVAKLRSGGATAIGAWIAAATELFSQTPSGQHHAILLTDGKIEGEQPNALAQALAGARGKFQCDCRGIGSDWVVDELRMIADALLGTVDIIAEPDDLEADFESMIRTAMSRGVPDVRLRVWAPQGSEVQFVRQVAPAVEDLTSKATQISPLVREFPTGAWSDESRDYHIAVRVPPAPVGSERLAARVEVVVNDVVLAKGLVKALWSTDADLTTRIDPAVAHYTGQAQLATAIRQGLAARAAGDERTATVLLGEAAKLAHDTGNDNTTRLLAKVVDVVDVEAGTVRLKQQVERSDEMALDTRSTKTTRIRREA